MRETKGYDKSFIDGTIKEHIKMKPNVEIKGVVTIQLFNEAGKLEREIKTENRITDAIARMAFMDYFCCRIRGNPWGRQWEYNDSEVGSTTQNKDNAYIEGDAGYNYSNHNYSYFTAPFRHLLLTDDSTPESSFARSIKGNIIGWADKSRAYVGTNTAKGTINLSETVFTESNLHFVFDFATSVANGTFQKIWWAELNIDTSLQEAIYGMKGISRRYKLDGYTSKSKNLPAPTNFTPGVTGSNPTYYPKIFKYNSKLYIVGRNYTTNKLCMGVVNIDTDEYSEIDLYTTMGLTSTSYAPCQWMMAQENNYVYMFYESYNNRLHRLNLDDNSKVEISLSNSYTVLIRSQIPEIPSSYDSTLQSYLRNGSIGCKNGKLYIPVRYYVSGSVNKTFILVCNPDSGLTKVALYDLSTITVPAGTSGATLNGYDLKLQYRDVDTWFVYNGNYVFIVDNMFNILDLSYRSMSFDYNTVLEDTAGSATKTYYYQTSGNNVYQWGQSWYIWEPVAAMTLLPSPVTKTPTNTMKIQYDFNIQRVDPFQP